MEDQAMEEIELEDTPDSDEDAETTGHALESMDDELAFLRDDSPNFAVYQAFKAYHTDGDYEAAIGKFQDAIQYEQGQASSSSQGDVDEEEDPIETQNGGADIITKCMYWMAESYVKIQQVDQGIEIFEKLATDFNDHYLGLAAQRRVAVLRT